MTWIIVVVFATIAGDVYMFTNPTFETRKECMSYITDKQNIPGLVDKMFRDYGTVMPIRGVNCLEKETIKEILNSSKEQKSSI